MSQTALAAPLEASHSGGDPWAWRAARTPAAAVQPRAGRRRPWALAAALAFTLGAGGWTAHTHSARLAPWVAPILRSIGYPWRTTGLKILSVSSRLTAEGRAPALLVEGEVVNASNREIDAPALRLAVRSADGEEIFVWTAHTAKTHLAPGARSRFSSRLEAPPSAGVDVAVALGTKGD